MKNIQRVNRTEPLQFNFVSYHVEEMNPQNVTVYKIVKKVRSREFEKAKFDVFVRALSEQEFIQWWEENRKTKNDQVKPFPVDFASAVVGEVNIASVNCADQASYLVHYDNGYRKKIGEQLRESAKFYLRVKGCGQG